MHVVGGYQIVNIVNNIMVSISKFRATEKTITRQVNIEELLQCASHPRHSFPGPSKEPRFLARSILLLHIEVLHGHVRLVAVLMANCYILQGSRLPSHPGRWTLLLAPSQLELEEILFCRLAQREGPVVKFYCPECLVEEAKLHALPIYFNT